MLLLVIAVVKLRYSALSADSGMSISGKYSLPVSVGSVVAVAAPDHT